MRKYIQINDEYFELSDIELRDEPIQNIYYWKWFDDDPRIVYKELDIREVLFCGEDEIPPELLPKPHNYVYPSFLRDCILWQFIKKLIKKII